MRAAPGRLVSKVGAEGVYTAGINPCEEWPKGLGLALKIEDGDDKRARPTWSLSRCDSSACCMMSRSKLWPVTRSFRC